MPKPKYQKKARKPQRKQKENVLPKENNTDFKISDEQASKIHGLAFVYSGCNYSSDSDSDGGKSDFDEEYFRNQPKPLEITKKNTVTIKSENIGDQVGIRNNDDLEKAGAASKKVVRDIHHSASFKGQSENVPNIVQNIPHIVQQPSKKNVKTPFLSTQPNLEKNVASENKFRSTSITNPMNNDAEQIRGRSIINSKTFAETVNTNLRQNDHNGKVSQVNSQHETTSDVGVISHDSQPIGRPVPSSSQFFSSITASTSLQGYFNTNLKGTVTAGSGDICQPRIKCSSSSSQSPILVPKNTNVHTITGNMIGTSVQNHRNTNISGGMSSTNGTISCPERPSISANVASKNTTPKKHNIKRNIPDIPCYNSRIPSNAFSQGVCINKQPTRTISTENPHRTSVMSEQLAAQRNLYDSIGRPEENTRNQQNQDTDPLCGQKGTGCFSSFISCILCCE